MRWDRRQIGVLAAALCCAGLGLWWMLADAPADPDDDDTPAFEDYPGAMPESEQPSKPAAEGAAASRDSGGSGQLRQARRAAADDGRFAGEQLGPGVEERIRAHIRRDRSADRASDSRHRDRRGGRAHDESSAPAGSEAAGSADNKTGAADAADAPDAGAAPGRPDSGFLAQQGYLDPGNAEVLGPRRWVAGVPRAEATSIKKEIEREIPPQYPISLKDRRQAVGRASGIVYQCFDELLTRRPEVSGQLVVGFEIVVRDGTARLEAPRTRDVVDLEDPGFLACIEGGLLDVQFQGRRDGRMTVEYPFFLGRNARGPTR